MAFDAKEMIDKVVAGIKGKIALDMLGGIADLLK